ncbi:MAG TPA: amino acid ABC transporter permease [Actinomycetota bacterium]
MELAPPRPPATLGEWIRGNLFSSPFNTVLTVVAGVVIALGGYGVLRWIFVSADWQVVKANLRVFMIGRFPLEETWRIWASAYLAVFLAGLSVGVTGIGVRRTAAGAARWLILGGLVVYALIFLLDGLRVWVSIAAGAALLGIGIAVGRAGGRSLRIPLAIGWIASFLLVILLLRGFGGVPPRLWGGFVLNLVVAVVGISLSFPAGVLLALGRRSSLPVIRFFSIGVIEIVRGVPLVTLLIFGQFVLPLLLPSGVRLAPILRALVMITIFAAAYVAEIVRGGLQGIHHGQYEAARALGLPATRMMLLIILPQALRNTIPAMIGQFISLFKDTSLIAVLGLNDLLDVSRNAPRLEFSGDVKEALLAAALLFWIVAYSMSRWSQRLERRLGVGER